MPDTSWALVADDGRPASVADALVDLGRGPGGEAAAAQLLVRWGGFVRSLSPDAAFAATADNVALLDGELRVACDLRAGVRALDPEATSARVCWHLARTLVVRLVARRPSPPDPTPGHGEPTVDELAVRLGGIADLPVADDSLARAKAHEAASIAALDGEDEATVFARIERESTWTVRDALGEGVAGVDDVRAALVHAWDALVVTRADLARAEAAAIELAAARALATSLGEELERDEWIRARLRVAKATKPARAAIELRRRVLRRP